MNSDYQAHYIALKTLQQRCLYLQQRLDAVEEENAKLKLDKVSESISACKSSDNNSLAKQVISLNQQKLQLIHQVNLTKNENQHLWSQLSKLMPGTLAEKLSIFATTNNQTFHSSIEENKSGYCDKESLEEISMKLINGILMGKTELENQYTQMIDLQKESNLDVNSFSFAPMQLDSRALMSTMNTYFQKLKDFKEVMYLQKSELSNAIESIKKFKNVHVTTNNLSESDFTNLNKKISNNVDVNSDNLLNHNQDEVEHLPKENTEDNSSSIKICPMCSQSFDGLITEFYKHVCGHFDDDYDEFEDANTGFELGP